MTAFHMPPLGVFRQQTSNLWSRIESSYSFARVPVPDGAGKWIGISAADENALLRSSDDGKTWSKQDISAGVNILHSAGGNSQHLSVCSNGAGVIMVAARTEMSINGSYYTNRVAVSLDDGLTWAASGVMNSVGGYSGTVIVQNIFTNNNGFWFAYGWPTTSGGNWVSNNNGASWTRTDDIEVGMLSPPISLVGNILKTDRTYLKIDDGSYETYAPGSPLLLVANSDNYVAGYMGSAGAPNHDGYTIQASSSGVGILMGLEWEEQPIAIPRWFFQDASLVRTVVGEQSGASRLVMHVQPTATNPAGKSYYAVARYADFSTGEYVLEQLPSAPEVLAGDVNLGELSTSKQSNGTWLYFVKGLLYRRESV